MKKISFLAVIVALIISACGGSETSDLVDTSLLKYSMPINIMAPAEAIFDHYPGDMNTLLIENEKDSLFHIRITQSSVGELEKEIESALKSEKEFTELDEYFVSYVKEDDNGYIFKTSIDDKESYDFVYLRIMGQHRYKFQTQLGKDYPLDYVEKMYKAVQPR